jgi:hypothetical protein
MKRFWLLLLAFVLPLQMSWAATHFCDDEMTHIAAAMSGAEKGVHKHAEVKESGKKSDSKQSEKLADCCGASHGCHGLHHLMAHPEGFVPSIGQAEVAATRDGPSTCGFLASRVERPKWLAA